MSKSSQQPFLDGLAHLFAGLSIADLRVKRAVHRVQNQGFTFQSYLDNLIIGAEKADRLLTEAFSSMMWVTAQSSENGFEREWKEAFAVAYATWQERTAVSLPTVTLPLVQITQRFGLTPPEVELLLLVLLPEFEPKFGKVFGFLQDDVTQTLPTINLLLDLMVNTFAEKQRLRPLLARNSTLIRSGLLVSNEPNGAKAWLLHGLSPAHSLIPFLYGQPECDSLLSTSTRLITNLKVQDQIPISTTIVEQATAVNIPHDNKMPIFSLIGPYGIGKTVLAKHLAATTTTSLLIADLATLSKVKEGFTEGLACLLGNGRLHAATLLLTNWDTHLTEHHPPAEVWQALQRYPHTIIISGEKLWQPQQHAGQKPIYIIKLEKSSLTIQRQTWQTHLSDQPWRTNSFLDQLTNLFNLTPSQIQDVVATAHSQARLAGRQLAPEDIYEAARFHSNQNLHQLASKIEPRYEWDDIILPADTKTQLRELVARIQQQSVVFQAWGFDKKLAYGKGVSALFVGESGTGKTMAADIIAKALNLDLYRIDLSALVSKYIGETEKNLEAVFREAETCNAILFFDEADAIFGKRTEVRDSHDRYANMEVSYLLQRMERYDGIVILASNLHANIDDAFTRRLNFIIDFPLPQASERAAIWNAHLPHTVPKHTNIDLQLLANRFAVAGGHIRNMTLGAAFLAAAAGTPVEMTHLLHAVRREYQKMGRLIDEAQFKVEHDS